MALLHQGLAVHKTLVYMENKKLTQQSKNFFDVAVFYSSKQIPGRSLQLLIWSEKKEVKPIFLKKKRHNKTKFKLDVVLKDSHNPIFFKRRLKLFLSSIFIDK